MSEVRPSIAPQVGVATRRRPLQSASVLSGDRIFAFLILLLALGVMAISVLIVWVLVDNAQLAFENFGVFNFLVSNVWNPPAREFGALAFLVGTLVTSLGALLLSVPFAVAAALFITEYAPRWLAEPVSYLVELLAAIPSVVYGFWGVTVLVPLVREFQVFVLRTPGLREIPFLRGAPMGYGVLAAIIILAIMIIPYTAAVARDVIRLVPRDQREAAYALGATKWEVLRDAVLPYARAGIFGGIILSLGRATAAV